MISVIVGAVAYLLRGIRVGDREAEIVSKTMASIGFVILGLVGWSAGDPVATALVGGLVLCAIGDVLLLWDRTFDAGLRSFLAGHIAYILAFHLALPMTSWTRWTILPFAAAGIAALVWLWPHLEDRKLSVSAYILVISLMVWGSAAVASSGRLGLMIAIGAGLFYLSDLTVARQRFVHPDFLNRVIGLPMYYAAQILIALSV